MKKILFIVSISVLIVSACDNRKFLEPAPAYKLPEVKTLEFNVAKNIDTIKLYTTQKYGEYTLKYKAFNADGLELDKQKMKFKIIPLLESGIHKIDNVICSKDTTLSEGITFNMKYYPANVKGTHKFILAFDNEYGQIFRDTITYEVLTYNAIPFTVVTTPTSVPYVRPTSTFDFNINLNTTDLTNQMKYYVHFDLAYPDGSIVVKKGATTVSADQLLTIGNNPFKAVLTNHPAAENYNIRVRVYDENGDEKNSTVSYNVRANQAPTVTDVSNTWITTYKIPNGLVIGPKVMASTGNVGQPDNPSPFVSCVNYQYIENIYNVTSSLNLSISEDVQITKVKIRSATFNNTYSTNSLSTYSIDISNGSLTYRYPNETPNNACWKAYTAAPNKYSDQGGYSSGGVFYGAVNWGTVNLQSTTFPNFPIGSTIYISVQDNEGVWSTEYAYSVVAGSLSTGPTAWKLQNQ